MYILLSFLSAFLASVTNIIDKWLTEKYAKESSVNVLILFSSMISIPFSIFFFLLARDIFTVPLNSILILIFSGMMYVAWVYFYLSAIFMSEITSSVPLFQLASVFIYILGYVILGESINTQQKVGIVIILAGSILLNTKFTSLTNFKIDHKVMFYMVSCTFLVALNAIIFKHYAVDYNFFTVLFWENVGFLISAVFIFCLKQPRADFIRFIRENKKFLILINLINEVTLLGSKLALNYAFLLTSVAIVSFIAEGFQPLLLLFIVFIYSKLVPNNSTENLTLYKLKKKVVPILLIVIGSYLLS